MEGNLRLTAIGLPLYLEENLPFLHALFYFVLEGNFHVQASRELILEERINGGFFALRVWGAYTSRGLFSEFYGIIFIIIFIITMIHR